VTKPRLHFAGPETPFALSLSAALDRLSAGLPQKPPTGSPDILIAAFPLHEIAAALRHEAAAHGGGRMVCHLGYDPGRVVIGPIVTPQGSPCLQCARLWAPGLGLGLGHSPAMPVMGCDLIAAPLASFVAGYRSADKDWAEILWFDLDTLVPSEHRLVPHPECERCGISTTLRPLSFLREEVMVSTETWRARDKPDPFYLADRLVDARFGVVRQFERETEAIAHAMTFAAFAGRRNPRQLEIGVGRTGCQADDRSVAMLEALERFSSFRPRGTALPITARYADIERTAIDPRAFILPDPAQRDEPGFHLKPFDPCQPYKWTRAMSLRHKVEVFLPLQLAYYDMPRTVIENEALFVSETSNGCALGASLEEAALFGLLEVIERDAYFSTWYERLIPERISIGDRDDTYANGMIARIEEAGFEVHILDIGVGFPVPSIAVLAIDRRPDAPVASIISTGAHPNPVQAVRGALVEVCTRLQHRGPPSVAALRTRAASMLHDPSLVMTMDDHAALYSHPESLDRLRFLTATDDGRQIQDAFTGFGDRRGTTNLALRLVELSDSVLDVAHDILVVDMTNALTASVGLSCVKVLAPGLLPVTFGHQYRRVSPARLAKIDPARRRAPDGYETWLPHNFQ
jgi:ribosomal protein S12 methylthiotransferase accessory factor